jgi:hypothetical protein
VILQILPLQAGKEQCNEDLFFTFQPNGGLILTNIRLPRQRRRIKPSKFSSSQIIGRFYIEESPGSPNWVQFQTRFGTGFPYERAEHCIDENHGRPPYSIGGPFRKIAISYSSPLGERGFGEGIFTTPGNNIITGVGFGKVKYVGGFSAPTVLPGWTEDTVNLASAFGKNSPLVPSTQSLEDSAWDRAKPKIEQGGMLVALREAAEVPRMMMTSAKGFAKGWQILRDSVKYRYFFKHHAGEIAEMAPKDAANHFLNHNFGWVPFIKDLTAFIDNAIYFDKKIRKISDSNGRWIKRRVILVGDREAANGMRSDPRNLGGDEVALVDPAGTNYLQQMFVRPPYYEVTEDKQTLAVAEGLFRFYVDYFDMSQPSAQSVLGNIRRQLALHGARITPSNLYKSTPWTWLIDWHTNTGRVIQSIQDQSLDDMAAKYLYVMHHQVKYQTISQILPFNAANGGPRTLTFNRVIDIKQRKEADSPFGFGLSSDELSPRQLALLGALGITRK